LGKHVLVGKDLSKEELEELEGIEAEGAVAALYVVQDEDKRHVDLDSSGAILAGLVYELTRRIAFEDTTIRPWADHLSDFMAESGVLYIVLKTFSPKECASASELREATKSPGANGIETLNLLRIDGHL
jgi:hypothetical protein